MSLHLAALLLVALGMSCMLNGCDSNDSHQIMEDTYEQSAPHAGDNDSSVTTSTNASASSLAANMKRAVAFPAAAGTARSAVTFPSRSTKCKNWCSDSEKACKHDGCKGCSQCLAAPLGKCKNWCSDNVNACKHDGCKGCSQCVTTTTTTITTTTTTTTTAPCCDADIAKCKACQVGQTVTEFCVANPLVVGCEMCKSARSFLSPSQLMTCPCKPIEKTSCMSGNKYDEIVNAVRNLMEDNLSEECDSTSCEKADFAGCVLRMAGHDFMDFKDGIGGSDGCTDMSHQDNKGLPECLATGDHGVSINDVYEKFCIEVSLADFLVIAAEAVMSITRHRAIRESPLSKAPMDFKSQFSFGRVTSTTCQGAADLLPNPEDSCHANERVFIKNLDFTWRQTAAIMGVHSLGRAQTRFSGYSGWWSDALNSRRFNNNYYLSLVAKGWMPERSMPDINGLPQVDKNQWQRTDDGRPKGKCENWCSASEKACRHDACKGCDQCIKSERHEMMLNTDLCLMYHHQGPDFEDERLNARDHSCCAWRQASGDDMMQVVANNNGTICGRECTKSGCHGSAGLRSMCCRCHGMSCAADCGFRAGPTRPEGDAVTDIMDFAQNEEAWVDAFLEAWGKATTNGMQGKLQPLGFVNGAGLDICS